ncbi:MAG: hypothetical protein FJX74_07315 [Armatimonadetes bacterium]|nr:hypothetical protein [Armatimonadota bacterium]
MKRAVLLWLSLAPAVGGWAQEYRFVGPVAPDTPLRAANESFDPLHGLLTPGQPATYLLTPDTTPEMLRHLLLMSALVGEGGAFGDRFSDGPAVSAQPYWPQMKGLEALAERLSGWMRGGGRQGSVAVVLPSAQGREMADAEAGALRAVLNQLVEMQTGYRVIAADELAAAVTAEGKLTLGPEAIKAVILPRVRIERSEVVEAARRLLAGGVKVIATHNLPKGPEGVSWVEEAFGVKSIDDINDAVFAKGNAIVVPAELGRLAPILNGMQCEDLFLYPPSRDVVAARYAKDAEPDTDTYLLYNASAMPVDTYLTIYRKCAPDVQDLDTGAQRPAPGYRHTEAGTTLLPLVLQPEQAVALVCRPAPTEADDSHIAQAPGLEQVRLIERGGKPVVAGLARLNGTHTVMLSDGRKGKARVEGLPPELLIDGAWRFATKTAFERQPTLISQARVRAVREGDDPSQWMAADLDEADWDRLKIGDPLPSLLPKWRAKWLGFSGDGEVRHYRRTFEVAGPVRTATLTVTADNGYEAFVNGELVGADGDWYKAETYDIAAKLRPGANVIGIRARNEGSFGGMLCEAGIALQDGNLVRLVSDGDWRVSRDAPEGWPAAGFDDDAWGAPEVGSSPPVAPWGEVPGLPPEPNTGREIWYRFDLPPGAARLQLPEGAKALRLYVDGRETELSADLGKPKGAALRQATLVVAGPDPLAAPIECAGDPSQILIGDWATQGLRGYAGEATYERVIDLPPEYAAERLFLDLGEVGACASVTINGKDAGLRLCRPYRFDLGEHVRKARNRLQITVANTLASAGDSPAPAGVIGPVRLLPYRQVEVAPE